MDDFLKLLDKLDEYYKTMCSGIIDCDLCEVINLLDDYGKYDVFFKIRPIIDNEDKEEYIDENYIDDEDEFYEDEFLEYEDIKDLYKQINDYDDEQLFEIEIPDEILDIYISKEFRSLIFSTEFNDYQREKIIRILKYVSVKYLSNDLIKDDYKDKYSLFCRTCNIDNFITKYLEDDEFCIFIADIYEILYEDIMKQNKTKKNISSVKTINELIREIFISIYKFNIEKLNCTEGVSIDILFSYFIGKENNDFINKRYKEILNGNKIEDLFSRNYARILLVTDYLRFKSLKVKNDYTSINSDGLINEISILIYLMNNSNENIIKRFNSDSNFVYEMVSSFINFNINLDDKTRKKCKDTELIKKINPMCILDYDISKDR